MPLAAPAVTLTLEPDRKAVRIDVAPPAGTDSVTIWRVSPSGNVAYVRGADPLDGSGTTALIARDYEAPLGLALDYYALATDAGGVDGATSAVDTITIPADACEAWLVDLARPINSLRVELESFGDLDYPAAVGVHRVLGRRPPVLTSLPTYTPEAELNVLTVDETERDAVRALLGSGFPFLLRTTPDWGIGNIYLGMLGFVEGRLVTLGEVWARRFRVKTVQVERPDPQLFAPSAPNSWQNVEDSFADWSEVLTFAKTWDQLGNTYPLNPLANPVTPWLPDDV
jgi:hypothetical protein